MKQQIALAFLLVLVLKLTAFPNPNYNLNKGKELYSQREFEQAIPFLKDFVSEPPNDKNIEALYKLGISYFEIHKKYQALSYLERCYALDKNYKQLTLHLALAYQFHYKFQKAILFFKSYKKKTPNKEVENHLEIDKHISECENAIRNISNNGNFIVENMGELINSPYDDYGVITNYKYDNHFYFTSTKSTIKEYLPVDLKEVFYDNIYTSNINKKTSYHNTSISTSLNTFPSPRTGATI